MHVAHARERSGPSVSHHCPELRLCGSACTSGESRPARQKRQKSDARTTSARCPASLQELTEQLQLLQQQQQQQEGPPQVAGRRAGRGEGAAVGTATPDASVISLSSSLHADGPSLPRSLFHASPRSRRLRIHCHLYGHLVKAGEGGPRSPAISSRLIHHILLLLYF